MVIDITLSTKRILDECQMQTSLDLQAMRARGVETADAVYDDWVIVEENEEPQTRIGAAAEGDLNPRGAKTRHAKNR